ncbi:hypothetical protein SAMN04487831_11757 [Pseudobutyrivibrio sp. UC1225]|uniref:hypothetical protein n=1 Tax=Pseudobutyrivibrio sp. UC1225 TaxID=1798185 RepID=UPI0008E14386|nr:hypothetical protein [Pseudobutyrivibrio sp. UC1225]SFO30188.1 hypothetical protein SAMN04487831_11757 [Pseudobutyrivibrio sp. UC1225]
MQTRNFRKNIFPLIVCSLSMFLFTSCMPVPEEVSANMDKYGENKYKEQISFEYCSVNDLKCMDIDDVISSDKNITYPDNVDFSKIKSISEGEFQFSQDYQKNDEYYRELFDFTEVSSEDFQGALNGDEALVYDDVIEKRYYSISDSGQLSYVVAPYYDDTSWINIQNGIEEINLFKDEYSDISINFKDESVTLNNELVFIDNYLGNILIDEDFDITPRKVYIRKDFEGNDLISVNAVFDYDGMILDFFGGGIGVDNNVYYVKEMNEYINMDITDAGGISLISIPGILEIKDAEPVDKIIDLQTAVNIFEKEMSTFNELKVEEIIPLYMIEPIYDSSRREYYASAGNAVKFTPVYSFIMAYGNDYSEVGILEGNTLVYVNINMITGKVTSNLEERKFNPGSGDVD